MKPWHCLLAIAAVAPSFAACYTYNIYIDDGGAGGASTSTTTGTDTVTSTGSTSVSTATSFPGCTDSKGFGDVQIDPTDLAPCPFIDHGDLITADPASLLQTWCVMHHQSESAPFILNNELRLDSACSEWTPFGFGPMVYRKMPNPSQDFAIWGDIDFEVPPDGDYHGAGLIFRWGDLASPQRYAIVTLYRHPTGNPTLSLFYGDGSGAPQQGATNVPSNFSGARIGLCAHRVGDHAPETHEIEAYYLNAQTNKLEKFGGFFAELPSTLTVDVGFASHAKDGGSLLQPRITYGSMASRTTAGDCFDGQLGPTN